MVNAQSKSKCTHFGVFETSGSYKFGTAEGRPMQYDAVWSKNIYIYIYIYIYIEIS